MIHFFGILDPSNGKRHKAEEAPGKSAFFGATEEACKKCETIPQDPDADEDTARERQRFLMQSFSPQF